MKTGNEDLTTLTTRSTDAKASLQTIVQAAAATTQEIDAITQTTEEVSKKVVAVTTVAEQHSSVAEEISAVFDELTAQSTELTATIRGMEHMAAELADVVMQFARQTEQSKESAPSTIRHLQRAA